MYYNKTLISLYVSPPVSLSLLFIYTWKTEIGQVSESHRRGGVSCCVSSWQSDWCGLRSVTPTDGTGARYRCMCLLWAAVPGCVHTATGHRSHRPSALLAPGSAVACCLFTEWAHYWWATLNGRASKFNCTSMQGCSFRPFSVLKMLKMSQFVSPCWHPQIAYLVGLVVQKQRWSICNNMKLENQSADSYHPTL